VLHLEVVAFLVYIVTRWSVSGGVEAQLASFGALTLFWSSSL